MKKLLKIKFTGFWNGFDPRDNIFSHLLASEFDLELSDNPDLLIYSVYDFAHLNYKCHKIFYTAENVRPNFNECDFAITFDYDSYDNRNMRMPLYRWNGDLEKLCSPKDGVKILEQKTKFCCTVVSNKGCDERNQFFKMLNEYKKVDSGGRYMNNIGGPVQDKMAFIKDYKFVLAFENSSFPGYTTEKIIDPMMVNSVPIYWGNPMIGDDFNPESFINIHQYSSFQDAIEKIIELDQNDNYYLEYLNAPVFHNNIFPEDLRWKTLEERLLNGVNQILNKPPVSKSFLYTQRAGLNKFRKKLCSKVYNKPHYYC